MLEGALWIDGRRQAGEATGTKRDPRTGEPVATYAVAGADQVREAVAVARRAQPAWAATPWAERRRVLQEAIQVVLDRFDSIEQIITMETGKPPCECAGGAELPVALECLAYYAARGERMLRPRPLRNPFRPYLWGKHGAVSREPLGVVAAITPWNIPFTLAMNVVVPALAAGNAVVLKPSEYAPLTGLEVARVFAAAGLPPGVLNVVTGEADTGRALVAADVDRVAFIGSVSTGRTIARALAEAGRRPPLLELGGKDPMIVCADADLDYAAEGAVWNAFAATGQQCCAVERVYVVRQVAEAFTERVLDRTRRLLADAFTPQPDPFAFGPLISEAARDKVHAQVTDAVRRGAHLRLGGHVPDVPGYWYPPTVLTGVTDDMRVMQQETFGPVLPIAVVEDEDEAIHRANDTPYGLTASVWTRDLNRGRRLAQRLRAGIVMVNDHASTFGMIDSPWGGTKGSGFGRTNGPEALLEFTEPRSLVVDRVPTAKVWWYPYTETVYSYFRWGNELLFHRSWLRRLQVLPRVVGSLLKGRRRAGTG